MAHVIKLTCPTCGHQWEQDLDQAQNWRTVYKVYRGDTPKTHHETYYFRCPRDGTEVAVDVEIKE